MRLKKQEKEQKRKSNKPANPKKGTQCNQYEDVARVVQYKLQKMNNKKTRNETTR